MIQAILFDFNGVIIDDERLQLAAYREVLAAEGIELTEEDYFNSLGMDDVSFVRASLGRANREYSDELASALIEQKSAAHRLLIADDLPLFPGVVTFIKEAARRYTLGVVSMARRTEIDYVLERSGLAEYLKTVVSAGDVGAHKPDPACYRLGFRLINERRRREAKMLIRETDCLVIEDSPPGVRAARGAGLRTLGVTNTVVEKELRAAGAEVVTPSLADWVTDAVHHLYDSPPTTSDKSEV
jgi:HAD superfamily hydrolase (TIGR01509 family)